MMHVHFESVRSAVKSLLFHRGRYAGVFFGSVLAAVLLTGSFFTGYSVKKSLERIADDRLGRVRYALETGEHFVSEHLAARLALRLSGPVVPVLTMRGSASVGGKPGLLPGVDVLGVSGEFDALFFGEGSLFPDREKIRPGMKTARRLFLPPEADLALRIGKQNALPIEVPFGKPNDRFFSLRLPSGGVLGSEAGGAFSLNANQVGPDNVFVPLAMLMQAAGLQGKVNLLLVADNGRGPVAADALARFLKEEMSLADYGISLRRDPGRGTVRLTADEILIRPAALEAIKRYDPNVNLHTRYFVNAIGQTPYSFVAAASAEDLPFPLTRDEMLISDWLADDLGAGAGSLLSISFYVIDERATLTEREAVFRVRAVLPRTDALFDRNRTPDFPGITDAVNCRDWSPGIPIDIGIIRPKDEEFWNRYGPTAKAVISLERGKELWGSRFGSVTSADIRTEKSVSEIERELSLLFAPARFGLFFRDVREESRQAAAGGVDFGGLFTGLSFFAIAGSLLLILFLFSQAVNARREEAALLLALGFTRRRLLSRFGLEAGLVAFPGSLLGALCATGYAPLMILLLTTLFRGAVGETTIEFYFSLPLFLLGAGIGFLFSLAVSLIALARQTRRPVLSLLRGTPPRRKLHTPRTKALSPGAMVAGTFLFIAAVGLIFFFERERIEPVAFFISSGLLFASFLLSLAGLLFRVRQGKRRVPGGRFRRVLGNLSENPTRTLLSVLILSLGFFITVAVGANTASLPGDPLRRDTGTGGFSHYVQTGVPVADNLNDPGTRTRLGMDGLPGGVTLIPLRVSAGDDFSCLNLNRAARPEILGVPAEEFVSRRAFSFSGVEDGKTVENPWRLLAKIEPGGVIPAVADEASLTWGLGLSLGDTLTLRDEGGRERTLRVRGTVSNSIFQGSFLIAETQFLTLFPSSRGYTRFLVDAPGLAGEKRSELGSSLQKALSGFAVEVMTTEARLWSFQQVTNTYLVMFLLIGGFGLLIGIGGFGVFIRHRIGLRRREFALLAAIGFERKTIFLSVLLEQLLILGAALISGLSAALIALMPAFLRAPESVPWTVLLLLVVSTGAGGFFWIRWTVRQALSGDLIGILKND